MANEITSQQLHDLMSPLWEREPELKPELLGFVKANHKSYVQTDWHDKWTLQGQSTFNTVATQLCESQMVRRLAKDDDIGISRCVDGFVVDVQSLRPFGAPTLIQALAAACTAVLDARKKEDEHD